MAELTARKPLRIIIRCQTLKRPWPVKRRADYLQWVNDPQTAAPTQRRSIFYGKDGLPELAGDPLPISGLKSSNVGNPAYYMDMPIHEQWPIYYDLDSNADNSWSTIPPEIEKRDLIALRRVTVQAVLANQARSEADADQSTIFPFTATKAENIYIMATQTDAPPAFAASGQFKEAAPGQPPFGATNQQEGMLVLSEVWLQRAINFSKVKKMLFGEY